MCLWGSEEKSLLQPSWGSDQHVGMSGALTVDDIVAKLSYVKGRPVWNFGNVRESSGQVSPCSVQQALDKCLLRE